MEYTLNPGRILCGPDPMHQIVPVCQLSAASGFQTNLVHGHSPMHWIGLWSCTRWIRPVILTSAPQLLDQHITPPPMPYASLTQQMGLCQLACRAWKCDSRESVPALIAIAFLLPNLWTCRKLHKPDDKASQAGPGPQDVG